MLVWACIAPHGGELIPDLANGDLTRMAATRSGMEELGRRCLAARPDSIVIYTPHGLCVEGYASLSVCAAAEGMLDGENGNRVCAHFPIDGPLAQAISQRAGERNVPVVEAAYLPDGVPAPLFPLDWGALVPLWFMGAGWEPKPNVVVICPSRALSRRQLIDLGCATAEAAAESTDRVAIICSADQGHGHTNDGPYGFSPLSSSFDRAYCQAVRENDLKRLLYWRDDWIEGALTDSYWQTLMLYGTLRHTPMLPELLSYEAPTYFGMACAAFTP